MPRRTVKTLSNNGKEIKFSTFAPVAQTKWWTEVKEETKQDERDLRFKDIGEKLQSRQTLKTYLMCLLAIQNIVVFAIVIGALKAGIMKELQIVFSVLIGGTLASTTSMVAVMVRWLFSDINYNLEVLKTEATLPR